MIGLNHMFFLFVLVDHCIFFWAGTCLRHPELSIGVCNMFFDAQFVPMWWQYRSIKTLIPMCIDCCAGRREGHLAFGRNAVFLRSTLALSKFFGQTFFSFPHGVIMDFYVCPLCLQIIWSLPGKAKEAGMSKTLNVHTSGPRWVGVVVLLHTSFCKKICGDWIFRFFLVREQRNNPHQFDGLPFKLYINV